MRIRSIEMLLLATLVATPAFAQSSSQDYRMERLTIAAAPGSASSADYAIEFTIAQEGPVGAASRCNDSFVHNVGFWSVFGETNVPVVLTVGRDAVDRTLPALAWSGSSAQFIVYRAAARDGVVDPPNSIEITTACSTVDSPPPASILYYVVQPSGN